MRVLRLENIDLLELVQARSVVYHAARKGEFQYLDKNRHIKACILCKDKIDELDSLH